MQDGERRVALSEVGAKSRILIVDDEPVNIQILNQILKADYETCFAINGEKALEASIQCHPDLIVLDVVMPNMDGYEVCRRLKASPETNDIPVIFATARTAIEDETLGFEVGASDFLTKPVSPPIVKVRIRNHLELKRQRDMLRALSYLDGLTGVANRRKLDETLEKEMRRCHRSQSPLSLIIADVDFFKLYNDTYGHLAGDDCLKRIAATLQGQAKRAADLVARYGGEEFAILLPETDLKGTRAVADRICAAINGLGLPHAASPIISHVTLSGGATVIIPDYKLDVWELIKQSDALLYQAKQKGRNQILVRCLKISESSQ